MTPEDGILVGEDGVARCFWGASAPEYLAYHDEEWGFPVADDVRLFEKLGPTTVYAFMQATGLVDDHLHGCDVRPRVEAARAAFVPPASGVGGAR